MPNKLEVWWASKQNEVLTRGEKKEEVEKRKRKMGMEENEKGGDRKSWEMRVREERD